MDRELIGASVEGENQVIKQTNKNNNKKSFGKHGKLRTGRIPELTPASGAPSSGNDLSDWIISRGAHSSLVGPHPDSHQLDTLCDYP